MVLPHVKTQEAIIPHTEQRLMRSLDGTREYRIYLSRPTGPQPEGGYPVIYVLDANSVIGTIVEAARLQTKPPHGYDPVVIVGIGYETDLPFSSQGRFYDYTMQTDRSQLPPRRDGSDWPETGGAEAFLDFVEQVVKPEVERSYPIHPNRQTLLGHSLGGLFTLYTMFTRTHLFQSYVAGSPSIWWNRRNVVEHAKRYMEEAVVNEPAAAKVNLLIALGEHELPDMLAEGEEMTRRLAPLREAGFKLEFKVFEGEGHVSVLPPLINRALRFALGGNKTGSRRI
ncbi:hypothetical protein FHS18_005002 [Paenibacillus phyllosphaerae]|uniref:Ferri-bacillibactin esterase BesA n=1 Tax=Paenibacillus phyllosphaerae TaxID=274593 RepID=A0A7W5FPZ3_9BACL|nr:alpha/beta hydrolase [Paenibacillus phyllosphaerae]MBB3112900.1 hypothetical protein [Paenibacillus phyllosphaerae]